MIYKLYKTIDGKDAATTVGVDQQVSFIFDDANIDYIEYKKWLEEGNVPLPADEPQGE